MDNVIGPTERAKALLHGTEFRPGVDRPVQREDAASCFLWHPCTWASDHKSGRGRKAEGKPELQPGVSEPGGGAAPEPQHHSSPAFTARDPSVFPVTGRRFGWLGDGASPSSSVQPASDLLSTSLSLRGPGGAAPRPIRGPRLLACPGSGYPGLEALACAALRTVCEAFSFLLLFPPSCLPFPPPPPLCPSASPHNRNNAQAAVSNLGSVPHQHWT